MKILVTSATDHRIDVQFVGWMCIALRELGIGYTRGVTDEYDKAIVFNGVLDRAALYKLDVIKSRCNKVYYMYDDCDLGIPKGDNITILSQFKGRYGTFFPISGLATMSVLWDNPILHTKRFDTFYGGTYKSRRDYSIVPDKESTMLVGDDAKWDAFKNVTRLPTVRDMPLVYSMMALCSETIIVSDSKHNDINLPLRAFECVFTNMNLRMYTGSVYTPQELKGFLGSKELMLELIKKGIINGDCNKYRRHTKTKRRDIW